jgi:hypothetical protein
MAGGVSNIFLSLTPDFFAYTLIVPNSHQKAMYKMIHVTNDTSKKDSTPILAKIPGKRYVHMIQFESM